MLPSLEVMFQCWLELRPLHGPDPAIDFSMLVPNTYFPRDDGTCCSTREWCLKFLDMKVASFFNENHFVRLF